MSAEPRHLFRRFIAASLDVFLVFLVVFTVTAPFVTAFGSGHFRFGSGAFDTKHCEPIAAIPAKTHDLLGGMPGQVNYCRVRVFGVDNGLWAIKVLRNSRGDTILAETRRMPVDDNGVQIWPGQPDVPLVPAVMVILSATALARAGGRTPGKALNGLRVVGLTGPADALRREGIRWMPGLVLSFLHGAADHYGTILGRPLFMTPVLGTYLNIGIIAFLVWYYLVPFFTGDRRARWDRIVDTHVERA